MRGRAIRIVCLLGLVAITGCSYIPQFGFLNRQQVSTIEPMPNQPLNHFHATNYSPHQIRRVVIVAPMGRQTAYREQESFIFQFANELRAQGVFDAVVDQKYFDCDVDTMITGRFDERLVAQLGYEYSADAVLFAQLGTFSAYSPMQAAASFLLVDVRESSVLLAADGMWDIRQDIVRKDFHRFVCQRFGPGSQPAEAYQQSPQEFLSYVATRMAEHVSSVR